MPATPAPSRPAALEAGAMKGGALEGALEEGAEGPLVSSTEEDGLVAAGDEVALSDQTAPIQTQQLQGRPHEPTLDFDI